MRLFSRVLLAGLAVIVVAGSLVKVRPAQRRRIRAARLEADALIASDGTRLPLAGWQPEGTPDAIVLALHGYGDYRRGFGLAGSWLAARGVALFAYDQRGFG
ncbi:MAG: alpha/beta hydrolase, partial [Geminicoccales bacterium]